MQATSPTIDRTKREHVAVHRRVIWPTSPPWPEDDAVILACESADGSEITAKGKQPAHWFTVGTRYRFLGRWVDDVRRGLQFQFDSVIVDTPLTFAGVVKYLTQNASNVGEKTAEKLYRRYGADAVATLRESPGRVSEDGIMPLASAVEAAQDLQANAKLERTIVDLHGLFAGRGFHSDRAIKQAVRRWGAKSPEVLRRNPFAALTARLAGAGFKRCDKMWLDMGKPAAALKRQMLCGWNWMRIDGNGHTWFAVEDVGKAIRESIDSVKVNPVKALKLGKRSGFLRFRKDSAGKLWVAESRKAMNEQKIADHIKRLSAWRGESLWPSNLPVSAQEGDGLPSEHQRDNWLRATAGTVGILAGSPGTGKTHTLAFGLREIIERIGISNVACCAPTGKAAVRMTQSLLLRGIDLRATTIHRLLQIGKNGHVDGDWGFLFNRENPLRQRVIIVDETSMIDADLFAALLDACADGTHILFVGDPYQLAPVGHGAPLRDLIAAGVPCGELTHVRRNAGQIVHACLRIKNGESFETADRVDLADGRNLLMIETRSEDESLAKLEGVLKAATRFHPILQTQVIVGLNKRSKLSRLPVNERLQGLLNADGRSVAGNQFRIGDKVICLRNCQLQIVEPTEGSYGRTLDPEELEDPNRYETETDEMGEPKEAYVANGEIGFVVAIAERVMIARMGEGDYCVRVPLGKGKADDDEPADENGRDAGGEESGRGSNFALAYAITVHKSQGSESPCIIVLIDPRAGMIADRNLWYTAISRASKLCVLIGQRATLDKQRAKLSQIKRKTFLQEQLAEVGAVSNGGG